MEPIIELFKIKCEQALQNYKLIYNDFHQEELEELGRS